MSEYIFKPPPPPPPKGPATPAPAARAPNQRGGRGGRGGHHSQGRGDGGGRGYFGSQQSRGGYGQQNRGGMGGRGNYHQQQQQQPARHFFPPVTQSAHLNPAFFPQIQQFQQQQQLVQPLPSLLSQQPQPSTLQPRPTNLFFPQWTSVTPQYQQYLHQSMPPLPPQPLRSYGDLTPPLAPSSYAYPLVPAPPPPAKNPKPTKPDMSHQEWLALNGGKLVGTDIKPPVTNAEIAAWISERRKRWPSARRVGEKEREDKERKKGAQMRWDAEKAKRAEEKQSKEEAQKSEAERKAAERAAKRKRKPEDAGDDVRDESDSSPEEISAYTRQVFRDDRRKAPAKQKIAICKPYSLNGSCPHDKECTSRHEKARSHSKKKEKRADQRVKQEKPRPSLYQRLVDKEMDRENELMLQAIKYLVESDALREDGKTEGMAKGGKESEEQPQDDCEDEEDDGEHAEANDGGETVSKVQPEGIEKKQEPAKNRQETSDRISEIIPRATTYIHSTSTL